MSIIRKTHTRTKPTLHKDRERPLRERPPEQQRESPAERMRRIVQGRNPARRNP